jgi:hypothetical protein
MRIVVYGEGAEVGGRFAPLSPIPPESHGPLHTLIARILEIDAQIPQAAAHFLAPLRLGARVVRGSDLHVKTNLDMLLTFPVARGRPELAIVVVDQDDDTSRRSRLQPAIESALVPSVLGICAQEFEAWVIADEQTASRIAGRTFGTAAEPEGMAPGEAKSLCAGWFVAAHVERHEAILRYARECDLDRIAARCPSFRAFRNDLRAKATP